MWGSYSIPSDALGSCFASTCSLRRALQVQVHGDKATLHRRQGGARCTLYYNKYVTQENVYYIMHVYYLEM